MRDGGNDDASVRRTAEPLEAGLDAREDEIGEKGDLAADEGVAISEFPCTLEAAREARARSMLIVGGAPNIVRGGSQSGNVAVRELLEEKLIDILASDYFYPAMLGAMVRLHADRVAPLPVLWTLVSLNPARAMGLSDRGRIAPGQRADLLLLDWPEAQAPAPLRTWVSGRPGYAALPPVPQPEPAL